MPMNALSAAALAPIRQRFIVTLGAREERLAEMLRNPKEYCEDPELLELVLHDLHKVKGVAPMLGMAVLGELATEAEDQMDRWLAEGRPREVPKVVMDCLARLRAALRAVLQDAGEPTRPPGTQPPSKKPPSGNNH